MGELALRLVRADDYRVGEWTFGKPLLALYGFWSLRGLRATERKPPPAMESARQGGFVMSARILQRIRPAPSDERS